MNVCQHIAHALTAFMLVLSALGCTTAATTATLAGRGRGVVNTPAWTVQQQLQQQQQQQQAVVGAAPANQLPAADADQFEDADEENDNEVSTL
jgi:hypothetical protein